MAPTQVVVDDLRARRVSEREALVARSRRRHLSSAAEQAPRQPSRRSFCMSGAWRSRRMSKPSSSSICPARSGWWVRVRRSNASASDFPKLTILGVLEREELAKVYAAADVFVFPSKTDTFGLVLLEAMACGLPVAAYPVTGPRDVIGDSKAGVLHEDLRTACLEALKLSREDALARARLFTWRAATEQFFSPPASAQARRPASPPSRNTQVKQSVAKRTCRAEAGGTRLNSARPDRLAGCRQPQPILAPGAGGRATTATCNSRRKKNSWARRGELPGELRMSNESSTGSSRRRQLQTGRR